MLKIYLITKRFAPIKKAQVLKIYGKLHCANID